MGRSGVALPLAMHHRLSAVYGLNGLRKHPAYAYTESCTGRTVISILSVLANSESIPNRLRIHSSHPNTVSIHHSHPISATNVQVTGHISQLGYNPVHLNMPCICNIVRPCTILMYLIITVYNNNNNNNHLTSNCIKIVVVLYKRISNVDWPMKQMS